MPGPRRPPKGGYEKPKNAGKTLRRLLSYVTSSPLLLAFVLICLAVYVSMNLLGTYMLRGIINDFVYPGNTNMAGFIAAVITLLIVYLLGDFAAYGQNVMMMRLAQKGTNRLRKDLFDALQNLPLSYFDRHTHGELMSRFTNDADNVQMALEQSIISLLSSVFMFVGLVAVMLYVNAKLFLITAAILVLTVFIFKKLGGRSRRYYQKQQAALGSLNGEIQEMMEGLKVVKAFSHEEKAKADFRKLNEEYRDAAQKANFFSTVIMPISGNLMNVGYALTAMAGGLSAVFTGFDIGGLVVYLNYSKQVGQPLNQISQQMTAVFAALAGAERIFEVMDTVPEEDSGTVVLVPAHKEPDGSVRERAAEESNENVWAWKMPAEETEKMKRDFPDNSFTFDMAGDGKSFLSEFHGGVYLRDVDFSYVPEKKVLNDITVYAKPGQKIAFVGSTGAGKTTITNLINRFYEIDDGLLTMDGINVREIAKPSLRRTIGMVLQDTHLFTGTIMDNIRYGRLDATDEECIAAAEIAGAHSFIRRLPEGYNTVVTGDGANLSQGQRQLLAIARAAVADPPVLVMDEATSSIDTRTEAMIQKGMDSLMVGRTTFVIAHRLSTVRNADCIVVIENGEICEKGTHEELLAEKGRYYELYTGKRQLA